MIESPYSVNFNQEWWLNRPYLAHALKSYADDKSYKGLSLVDAEGYEVLMYDEFSEELELLNSTEIKQSSDLEFNANIEPNEGNLRIRGLDEPLEFYITEETQEIKCYIKVNSYDDSCSILIEDADSGDVLINNVGFLETYYWYKAGFGLYTDQKFIQLYSYATKNLTIDNKEEFDIAKEFVEEFITDLEINYNLSEEHRRRLLILHDQFNASVRSHEQAEDITDLFAIMSVLCDVAADILDIFYKDEIEAKK